MQDHRTDASATLSPRRAAPPPAIDRVCGLGLCDALHITLERNQIESLREEIDEQQRVFDEAITAAIHDDDADELARVRYEREVLDMIAKQLPGANDVDAPIVVCGPAQRFSSLISGAAEYAAERLVDHLSRRPLADARAREAQITAAHVAAAWAETDAAASAVEGYSFDPDFEPVRP